VRRLRVQRDAEREVQHRNATGTRKHCVNAPRSMATNAKIARSSIDTMFSHTVHLFIDMSFI
jgi:hypothetical protein